MENKKLLEEIGGVKKWMNFLDNKSNYNRSFRKEEATGLIKEDFNYEDPNDTYGSPETESDALLLGNEDQETQLSEGGSYIVISTDINGDIYVKLIEADSEEAAVNQSENEMLTQILAISETKLMDVISQLTQYLPEDITAETEPDKPPFIDEPKDDIIDEDYV